MSEYGWNSVPEWGVFLLSLGAFAASYPKTNTRLVVGAALPTRAYAAAFVGTGVVCERTVSSGPRLAADIHFRQLCALKDRTPVTLMCGKKKSKGVLVGCRELHRQMWLEVQLTSKTAGGATQLVQAKDCLRIEVVDGEGDGLQERLKWKEVKDVSPFARRLLGDENVHEFNTRSRLDCLLVGRLNLLQEEITGVNFACAPPLEEEQGVLQDVLRVRKFLGAGHAFRSEAVAAGSQDAAEETGELKPHVTVFDGSTGFSKWRDYCRDSHWVVLLDRTEPGFEGAAALLNAEYGNRVGEEKLEELPEVPAGLEVVAFTEACR